jgi:hypothetical protein
MKFVLVLPVSNAAEGAASGPCFQKAIGFDRSKPRARAFLQAPGRPKK